MLGHRFTGNEAVRDHIAIKTCPNAELLPTCKTFGRDVIKRGAYNRDSLRNMKTDVYQSVKAIVDWLHSEPRQASSKLWNANEFGDVTSGELVQLWIKGYNILDCSLLRGHRPNLASVCSRVHKHLLINWRAVNEQCSKLWIIWAAVTFHYRFDHARKTGVFNASLNRARVSIFNWAVDQLVKAWSCPLLMNKCTHIAPIIVMQCGLAHYYARMWL